VGDLKKAKSDKADFYLVCGPSGSGKTVLSNRIIDMNPGIRLIDADNYYKIINGDECIRDNIFEVWMKIFEDIHSCEIKEENVLLSTAALTAAQRNQFVVWFPTFRHHILWMSVPREKCVEGNMNRRRWVPSDVMTKQWNEMEFPNASEYGWDTVTHVTHNWKDSYTLLPIKGHVDKYLTI